MDKKLIRDDDEDPRIEALVRTKARLEHEIKERKAQLDGCVEELAIELKKLPKRAYVHGPIAAYIERKEKVVTECADETGEDAA